MNTETKTSLREWAKKNKVWEPENWKTFLEEDLVPFYKYAFTLNSVYKFIKRACGKSSLGDIENDTARDKIKVALYGGVEPDSKDFSGSFAKFMYDTFGICAENASSFEQSIEYYKSFGDGITVSINPDSWINHISIGELVYKLRDLIAWNFCKKLGIKLTEIGIQESYPCSPIGIIESDALLPQHGEKPEKLISLINEFKQKAMDLSIGVNSFMTFVFYTRAIPLIVLMKFLGCDVDKVTELTNFLGLGAYSMIDQREINLPTKSPERVMLLRKSGSLSGKILDLHSFLLKVDPFIEETCENMIKESIKQVHISFEPWKNYYEPLFSSLNEILKDEYRCVLEVESGKVIKITNGYSNKSYYRYREIELPQKVWLRDLLIKISPVVSMSILDLSSNITELRPSPLAKDSIDWSLTREWIEEVIKNEGKISNHIKT